MNAVSTWNHALDEDLPFWADIGIDHAGLTMPKLAAVGADWGTRAMVEAGLRVSRVTGYPHQLADALEVAPAVDAPMVYMPPLGAGPVFYEESAEKYGVDIAPHVARARELGVRLAMENTNPLQTAFELELLGPEIASEGYKAPIVRSLERASEMLERLGT